MVKKFLIICSLILLILTCLLVYKTTKNSQTSIPFGMSHVEKMPIIENDIYAAMAHGGVPQEERGPEFRKWLAAGVKIDVVGGSGSGTIIYYDPETKWAYIQSCGHLWNGNMSASDLRLIKPTCKIVTWYHNDQKLNQAKSYTAEVLCYSNKRGFDVSLLRFKPDWEPEYLPIASEDFVYQNEMKLHSVGCDGGREIAHYDVRYIGTQSTPKGDSFDLVTTENSPRPGRSGGGLSTDQYYIGICWGTSDRNGNGNGFFTPLSVIREFNEKNGFGWLNEVGYSWARLIPIVDRNNPQGQYPNDYVPIPR